jgi:DNA-binding NarL/FixJ family response regulator
MSGRETYESLRKIMPDIKVLLSSGYSIEGQAQGLLDSGCNGFIQKPFDAASLSAKVQAILQPTLDK